MDFQKYKTNLNSQLTAVNADIVEKEEQLDKLKEFRSRVKGGLEVVDQIERDMTNESANTTPDIQQEIRETVQELTQ
jgi:hypothetical protein|tara:strand:+ start:241 stop:471 length:231 start_codon:yes stop_codon:yes gene_type:complete